MKDLGGLPQANAKTGSIPGFAADKVSFFRVQAEDAGQRIDNFLLRLAKGVPKSHVYRVIRGGEVRVNKKRVDVTYRLEAGDELRVPPMRIAAKLASSASAIRPAEFPVLFEDDYLLVINKPAGVAVHGGSGVSFGVIEQLRAARPLARYLELVHRLDRETSGILMLAKKRSALVGLHEQIRAGQMDKRYLALVAGDWQNARQHVRLALNKTFNATGERHVYVVPDDDEQATAAHTIFNLIEKFSGGAGVFALLEAELKTGRTHQIRVHLSALGFPIAGDEKYGDFDLNKTLARPGAQQLKRMFLHAWKLGLRHPLTDETLQIEAGLPDECERFLGALR